MMNSMLEQYLRRFGMIYDLDLLTAFFMSIIWPVVAVIYLFQEAKKMVQKYF